MQRTKSYLSAHPEKETCLLQGACRESARILVIVGILLSVPNFQQKNGAHSAENLAKNMGFHMNSEKVNHQT